MSGVVAKRKRVKLKCGDLFELQLSDGQFGYGVIVRPGGVLYAVFLRTAYSVRPTLEELERDEFALVGTTMDALFYHGRWTVIARDLPLPPDIPYPNWKVMIEGVLRTTDFEGSRYWPMRAEEVDLLDYKFSRSPIAFQKALEAMNRVGEWRPDYEELTWAYAKRRVTRA